jgi:hypothetical protein
LPLEAHQAQVNAIAVLKGTDTVVTASDDRCTALWDANHTEPVRVFAHPSGRGMRACAIGDDSAHHKTIFTGCDHGSVFGWDPRAESHTLSLTGFGLNGRAHNGPITSIAYRESHLLTSSWDCTASLWDLRNSSKPLSTLASTDWILSARFLNHSSGSTLKTVAVGWEGQPYCMESGSTTRKFSLPLDPSSGSSSSSSLTCMTDIVQVDRSSFATKLVKDYQTEEFDSKSNRRQARAGAVLYFLTVAFAFVQGIVLIANWNREKIVHLKLVFIVLVALNAAVRGVYMLIPSSTFVGNESIQFIIFELPSFLFFSVYLSIIYLWVTVTLKASQFRQRKGFMGDAESIARDVFVVANIVLYAIFIVFMFLISILPSIEKPSVCFLGAQNNSLRNSSFYRTKLAYWCILAGLCVIVSVGFLIGASMLLRLVLSVERTGVSKHAQGSHRTKRMNKLILITVVAAVCTVFLLIRSALFLYASITTKSINIIVFVLLEVIPSCGLLYYLRPYLLMGLFKSSRTSSRSSGRSRSATDSASATSPRHGSSKESRQ